MFQIHSDMFRIYSDISDKIYSGYFKYIPDIFRRISDKYIQTYFRQIYLDMFQISDIFHTRFQSSVSQNLYLL